MILMRAISSAFHTSRELKQIYGRRLLTALSACMIHAILTRNVGPRELTEGRRHLLEGSPTRGEGAFSAVSAESVDKDS